MDAPSRPSFVPVVFRYAARLEQLSWDEFVGAPAATAHALSAARGATGADGIFTWFDPHAEAECLGMVSARNDDGSIDGVDGDAPDIATVADRLTHELLPRTAELTRRLSGERAHGVRLFTAASGPASLTRLLRDSAPRDDVIAQVARWMTRFVREQCEAGADVVVLAEDEGVDVAEFYAAAAKPLSSVFKIARHYTRPCVVLSRDVLHSADSIGSLERAGDPPHLLVDPKIDATWGIVPVELLATTDGFAAEAENRSATYLTSWEVAPTTEPERLAELGRHIHGKGHQVA